MTTPPPFAYYGGKTRLADRIVGLFPPHAHYVEPFAGSLAVLMAKRPSKMETVNDLDGDLMNFWRVLREQPAELVRVCALTPHSRAEFREAYNLAGNPDLERARRVWCRLSQSRTGTLRNTGWRFYVDPAGSSCGMPGYLDGYVGRMSAAAERLHRVSLECRPGIELIRAYGAQADVLLYVDPPYLGSTRASSGYRREMRGEVEHKELLDALNDCSAGVVLSGYGADIYDRALTDWDRVEIAATTGQGGTRQERTEVLWSNRPISDPDLFGSAV
jgi:DNA adenine methylase